MEGRKLVSNLLSKPDRVLLGSVFVLETFGVYRRVAPPPSDGTLFKILLSVLLVALSTASQHDKCVNFAQCLELS